MKYFIGLLGFLIFSASIFFLTDKSPYILMLMCFSFVGGLLFCIAFVMHQKEKLAPYKRQLEKMSVMNDTDSSKVEILEAKIKTLEAALKQSLENK